MSIGSSVHCVLPEDIGKTDNEDVEFAGWYFWDETSAYRHGPFGTKAEAEAGMVTYCAHLG